jgi:hypothetical protein
LRKAFEDDDSVLDVLALVTQFREHFQDVHLGSIAPSCSLGATSVFARISLDIPSPDSSE